MAQNLQLLKRRIKTAHNISQIAKAMEMIAASKIKRAQGAVNSNKPYAEKITEVTQELLLHLPRKKHTHPYIIGNNSSQRMLIVVSPDKGLCGSLVTNLLRKFLNEEKENTLMVSVGKKVQAMVARLGYQLIASFAAGTHFPSFGMVYPIIDIINEHYLTNKVSKVEILYSEFRSIFSQQPTHAQFLPITLSSEQSISLKYLSNYILEPNPDLILSSLLPHYLEAVLYHALIQAFTSEQAARMIAMQNAKNNAYDIEQYLTLEYNKTRQERITSEILDLANGQRAQYL